MQRSALAAPVDVVVATPTRFAQHQEDHNVHVGDVRWLVLDEADTMFDQVGTWLEKQVRCSSL